MRLWVVLLLMLLCFWCGTLVGALGLYGHGACARIGEYEQSGQGASTHPQALHEREPSLVLIGVESLWCLPSLADFHLCEKARAFARQKHEKGAN